MFVDNVNLIIHEGRHLLFGWFGPTLGLWGGTILQLFIPATLALHFATKSDLAGTVFCTFFLFENFLYISVYMADARAQMLPLVTVGDPEQASHDWFEIFSPLGLLSYDVQIAKFVYLFGWLGMIGSVMALWYFSARNAGRITVKRPCNTSD